MSLPIDSTELDRLRCDIAGMRCDLALLKLGLALRKYSETQPRNAWGRWTDGRGGAADSSALEEDGDAAETARSLVVPAGGFGRDDMGMSVDQFMSKYCAGSIRREIPSQFLDMTIAEMLVAKRRGVPGANKCFKLLDRDEYRK